MQSAAVDISRKTVATWNAELAFRSVVEAVYLAYVKPGEGGASTTAIARGRLEGHALENVRDIFVANAWTTRDADIGTCLAFDRDEFFVRDACCASFSIGTGWKWARRRC